MVNLVRDGQPVRMSKRAGTVITLDDLVEAIGVDAARYSLIRSSVDTPIDIDLALWSSASNENPVYYVQYAHARLSALARNAAELGLVADTAHLELLTHEKEGTLIRNLGEFPRVLKTAAALREPHRVSPLPRGPGRRLPPVLRLLPGAAAGRRSSPPNCTPRGWRCARPPARSSPTAWRFSASPHRSGCERPSRRPPARRGDPPRRRPAAAAVAGRAARRSRRTCGRATPFAVTTAWCRSPG